MPNKLDQFYRSLVLTKYFTKGWGKPENLKRICEFRKIVSDREACYKLVSPDYPVYVEREVDGGNYSIFDGHFFSPFAHYLPEVVPEECHKAYFQMILPKKCQFESEEYKPIVLQIAGTGDQHYWRRRNLIAKPLIKDAGIGSIILENPFYGRRKPKEQTRTILQNVCDIFVMGGCLIFESMVLFHFCERLGYGPLGVTGLSMGGHMASLIAACWPKPLIVVPCLSGTTSSHVFTEGVISRALNWNMLEQQFHSNSSYKEEIVKMINIENDDAYLAGQEFAARASNYSYSTTTYKSAFVEYPFADYGSNSTADNLSKSFGKNYDSSNLKNRPADWLLSLKANKRVVTREMENLSSVSASSNRHKENSRVFASSASVDNDASSIKHVVANDRFSSSNKCGTLTNSVVDNNYNRCRLEKMGSYSNLLNYLTKFVSQPLAIHKLNDARNALLNSRNAVSEQQALSFMNGIMDEVTHLKNYPIPVDTSLVIAVCAEDDAYVPLKGMSKLDEVWPGAQVRYVKGGHVRAYIQYQKNFRSAIVDAFSKYRSTYIGMF